MVGLSGPDQVLEAEGGREPCLLVWTWVSCAAHGSLDSRGDVQDAPRPLLSTGRVKGDA